MLLHQIFECRVLLIIRQCDAAQVGLTDDMRDQRTTPKLDVIWVSSQKEKTLTGKNHLISFGLLGGQDAADNFGHHQTTLFFIAALCHRSDLRHHLLEITFALE